MPTPPLPDIMRRIIAGMSPPIILPRSIVGMLPACPPGGIMGEADGIDGADAPGGGPALSCEVCAVAVATPPSNVIALSVKRPIFSMEVSDERGKVNRCGHDGHAVAKRSISAAA